MSGKRNLDSSSPDLPSLPPLHPQEGVDFYSGAVGVANPLIQHDQDLTMLTLKQLPPKQEQELTPNFLRSHSPSTSSNSISDELLPYTPPSPTHTNKYNLPYNKNYHVFVTHSTYDTLIVQQNLIDPLKRSPYNFKAVSSSDFMAGQEYSNDDIKEAMQQSCAVIIGLSEPYINSPRCDKEWKRAIELSKRNIVIAMGTKVCSRPQPIKCYLYLDLMDESKREKVWEILIAEIERFVLQVHNKSPRQDNADVGMSELFDQYQSQSIQQSQWSQNKQLSDKDGVNIDYGWGMTSDGGLVTSDTEVVPSDDRELVTNDGDVVTSDGGLVTSDTEVVSSDRGVVTSDWGIVTGGNMTSSDERSDNGDNKMMDTREKEHPREEGELSDTGSLENDCHPPLNKIPKNEEDTPIEFTESLSVAGFYDSLAKPGADKRNESPIYHMRNFNNWVKSVLIRRYLTDRTAIVLDLCCGKGGDLNKWKEGRIEHLVCADISEVSIDRCKERYHGRKKKFSAEFIVADCCQVRLRDKYENSARRFHMTSCQFSLHYSFEKYEKTMMMLQNACENLLPDGFFIGTTVDSNELVRRLRENGCQDDTGAWTIGNDIYSVTLDSSINPHETQLPLFNCKYHFKLEGVVNVPEYLVYYPLLVSMLEEFGMIEILHQNFYNFFQEHRHNPDDVRLLYNMSAFDRKTGTMSSDQWEAIGLYLVFVFQKKS